MQLNANANAVSCKFSSVNAPCLNKSLTIGSFNANKPTAQGTVIKVYVLRPSEIVSLNSSYFFVAISDVIVGNIVVETLAENIPTGKSIILCAYLSAVMLPSSSKDAMF